MPLFRFLPIFALCFASFLAGWLTAIFISPGKAPSPRPRAEAGQAKGLGLSAQSLGERPGQKPAPSGKLFSARAGDSGEDLSPPSSSFFEELKDNILILFDPYKMDSLIKKSSSLGKENSYIKKPPAPPALKAAPPLAKKPKPASPPQESSAQDTAPDPPQTEPEQKTESQKIQEEHDKANRLQLAQIAGRQNFFTMDGKLSFLADALSDREKALERAQSLREKYPLWSFLIKAYPDHTRIYLGPFPSKKKAMEFKKAAPRPPPFSMDFLEEVAL